MDNLLSFVNQPESPDVNFKLAVEYENQKHYAGAISHFLRCAEYGEDKDLIYESLVHLGVCFRQLGNRSQSESGWFLQAIAHDPTRPEAYWMMSLFHEYRKNWQEGYTYAVQGIQCENRGFTAPIEYEPYKLIFQQAVCAWWIGRTQESRDLFFSLPDFPLDENYIGFVQNNLSRLGSGVYPYLTYTSDKAEGLRYKFPGYEKIKKNYSQVYQDLFVLSMVNGEKGYYLEIGSADPFKGSNTALLEQIGWDGVSLEIDENLVKKFKEERKNKVLCKDASVTNYTALLRGLNAPVVIDYLQIDCEPPKTSYDILLSIPFGEYHFRVITFEHDYYADASRQYRELSRKFLEEQGYVLAVSDIAPDHKSSFEDWWVHPDLVDENILKLMQAEEGVKQAEEYMITGMQAGAARLP